MKRGYNVHKAIFILLLSIFILDGSFGILLGVRFCRYSHGFTMEEERELGKRFKRELDRHLQFIEDYSVHEYIESLGEKIVSQLDYKPFDFDFSVYLASDPNAFATPGGYIYISSGLITLAENESEFAGVLCHEMAHVTARHISKRMEKQGKLNIGTLAAILAGIFLGGGGKAVEAVGAFSMAAAQSLSLKYSREDEEEADRLGLSYMLKAGYDRSGMITFLEKMKKYQLSTLQPPPYLLTHPGLEIRVEYLSTMLKRFPEREKRENGFEGFRRMQARVIVDSWTPKNAINHFAPALESSPQRLDLIWGIALANMKMKNYGEANKGLKAALIIRPDDSEILKDLGICYFSQGKYKDAISSLERSVAINEKDASAFYYLGRAYQESGDFQKAIDAYVKVKRIDRAYVDVYYNLGEAYGKKGLLGEAYRSFGDFSRLNGNFDSALLRYNKALKYYDEGTKERKEVLNAIDQIKKIKKVRQNVD